VAWSRDVDLNDGELQKQYNKYIGRLESVKKAGLVQEHASNELRSILEDVAKDLQYLQSGNLEELDNNHTILYF